MSKPWEREWGVDASTGAAEPRRRDGSPKPWEKQWAAPEPPSFDMDTYLTAKMGVESSGGTQLVSGTSSARGQYQFTESTWEEVTKRMGVNWSLEDRFDEQKSRQAAEFYVQPSLDRFTRILGRPPAYHELYTAHFLGPTGGARVLQAPKTDPISKHVSQRALAANRNIFYDKNRVRTVGEVMQVLESRFNRWIK